MGSSKPYTIITNGIINKHIYNQDELDYYLSNGWILGKHRSAEQLDSWKRKFHNTYQNKSDEEKEDAADEIEDIISNIEDVISNIKDAIDTLETADF